MPEPTAPPTPTVDFMVPDLGEGLEEATIVSWLVEPGQHIALNQGLCVLETAKAEVEVPSPYDGTVVAVGGAPGDTLRVGTLLARFAREGAEPAAEDDSPASGRPQPTLVGYGHDESIDRSRRRLRGGGNGKQTPPSPGPAPAAAPDAGTPGPSAPPAPQPGKPLAAPPVRKLARDLGVDLTALAPGSGPNGVITRSDVQRAAASPVEAAPSAPTTRLVEVLADTVIPVTGVRARVADRMTTSRRTIPDATCSVVVDCTRLLEVRAALNDAVTARGSDAAITPFALLCRVIVQALTNTPILNASFDEGAAQIRVHGAVHLGIGTATPRGLVVTVVRDAQARSTLDLATDMARLSSAAREGTLPPADLIGSTFTVSNFGALGLDEGIPVINHPEAAIVGVGAVKPRPHVVDGEIVARSTASITLAFDHRVCDGADAARFLGDVRRFAEAPELLLLDR